MELLKYQFQLQDTFSLPTTLKSESARSYPHLISKPPTDLLLALRSQDYGYHIHDGLSGSMHTHVLNWKIDIDILGTSNTVGFHKAVADDIKYPWSPKPRKTMKLVRSELENEDDSKLNWEMGSMVLIYNKDEKNKFGEDRAWRIMPSRGNGIHLPMNESSNLGDTMAFGTHNFYVTKHHDSEYSVAHRNNAYDPYNPVVDFGKYFDGEDLVQEDLVLWGE